MLADVYDDRRFGTNFSLLRLIEWITHTEFWFLTFLEKYNFKILKYLVMFDSAVNANNWNVTSRAFDIPFIFLTQHFYYDQ